uniref:Uncharacterized protein n=1 Tax=Meloidogyne enterolobii TaxID=390850 RepID=A0A6V7U3F0_MELEN|nr:unnamed protein product [Meloidogyne enterolobii]
MYFLPAETKLDVLKCLNSDQLCSIKQANCYLRNFIDEHGAALARMEFAKLSIIDVDNIDQKSIVYIGMTFEVIDLELGVSEFILNDQLK